MNRRQMITTSGMAIGGFAVGTGFAAPACGVSKEKAVKYTGIAVSYLKDVLPIVSQLGGTEIVNLINQAIPALEKLKTALDNSEFPTAGSVFDQVTGILGQIANALFHLPESPRRNQIMGILTLVNVTMRTISLFVETETPLVNVPQIPSGVRKAAAPDPLRRAFQATKF